MHSELVSEESDKYAVYLLVRFLVVPQEVQDSEDVIFVRKDKKVYRNC